MLWRAPERRALPSRQDWHTESAMPKAAKCGRTKSAKGLGRSGPTQTSFTGVHRFSNKFEVSVHRREWLFVFFFFSLSSYVSVSTLLRPRTLGMPLGSFGGLTFAPGLDCESAESSHRTGRPKPVPSHFDSHSPSGIRVSLAKTPLDYEGPIACGYTSTLARCQLPVQAHGGPTNQRRLAEGTDNVPRQQCQDSVEAMTIRLVPGARRPFPTVPIRRGSQ